MSENKKPFSNFQTLSFVFILCFGCALVLSVVSYSLKEAQENAKELYRSKQLLIAAKILDYQGKFMIKQGNKYLSAEYDEKTSSLIPSKNPSTPSRKEILSVYNERVVPMVVTENGNAYSFAEADLDFSTYLSENQKYGYADLKYKLIYFIYPSGEKQSPSGFVIPVNGYGLWDAIYGYLGLEKNGDTILATTWYDQKETPGLGGNISLPSWQKQFEGKEIFQPDANGEVNPERAPIGIKVLKTTVKEELGSSPKGQSAVDGIAGATVTSNGVTAAYRKSLSPYRKFLVKQFNKE